MTPSTARRGAEVPTDDQSLVFINEMIDRLRANTGLDLERRVVRRLLPMLHMSVKKDGSGWHPAYPTSEVDTLGKCLLNAHSLSRQRFVDPDADGRLWMVVLRDRGTREIAMADLCADVPAAAREEPANCGDRA